MVNENTDSTIRAWLELLDEFGKVVYAIEEFYNDSLNPEVVAPYFLDEFSVMLSFDPDSRCPCHSSLRIVYGD
jgi:hypothetical protein